jgi:hypothetical protein
MPRKDKSQAVADARAWDDAHPDELRRRQQEYERRHRAARREAKRAWAQAHKAKLAAYHKAWSHANRKARASEAARRGSGASSGA